MKEKTRKTLKVISIIVMFITLRISCYTYKTAKELVMLPQKYINYIIYIMVSINVVSALLVFIKKAGNIGKIVQILLCTVLSGLMVYSCIIIPEYKGRLGRMFTSIPEISVLKMHVYTLKDSTDEKLKNLIGKTIGIQTRSDIEHQDIAMEDIQNQVKKKGVINVKEYEDIYSVVEALYNKEVDAILLTDAYAEIISENADFYNFQNDTKTIYTITQEIVDDNIKKAIPTIVNTPFVIAIAGNDSFEYDFIKNDKGRTDVSMVVAVNPLVKKIVIVTITRDAYLPINGETDKMDRLTNSSTLGVQAWEKAIEYGLGIKIDKYMRINFTSFINAIQYLGGLDVDNPYYFQANRSLGGKAGGTGKVEFKQGIIHINGYEALSYSRERKSLPLGDFDRNIHNAILLKTIIEKIQNQEILSNIDQFLNAVEGTFETDVTIDELNMLIKMQLEDKAKWQFEILRVYGNETIEHSYTLGGGQGEENMYVAHLDENMVKAANERITALLNEDIEE
ncbi:MAG: LCP family protein [Lachnospiraceae bacterium]|nr:LCP family protein [Erysipelotrichaceae bacterium]MBR4342411.1 LCP family protein [Lachnospiraceae bacterium]